MNKIHTTSKIIERSNNLPPLKSNEFVARKMFSKREVVLSSLVSSIWNRVSNRKNSNGIFFSNNSFIEKQPSVDFAICLSVKIYALNLNVYFDQSFLEHLLTDVVSLNEFNHLPEELQCLVVDSGIRDLITSMGATLPDADLNLKISPNSIDEEILGHFEFCTYREQDFLGRITIEFDNKSVTQLEMITETKIFQLSNKKSISNFPVFGRILIDTVFIKQSSIFQLSQGDVLLTHLNASDTSAIIYFSKKILFHVEINDEQLEITRKGVSGMQNIEKNEIQNNKTNVSKEAVETNRNSDSIEDKPGNEEKARVIEGVDGKDTVKLSDIDIELTFDLGNVEVSLSNIPSIKPGYILEMPNSYERHVYIRNNGRLVAIGELVQVGENLGVEISEIKYGIS